MSTTYTIKVTLKPVIADPQGLQLQEALHHLGYKSVSNVHVGKVITLITDDDTDAVVRMCELLLANPTIEDFEIVEG